MKGPNSRTLELLACITLPTALIVGAVEIRSALTQPSNAIGVHLDGQTYSLRRTNEGVIVGRSVNCGYGYIKLIDENYDNLIDKKLITQLGPRMCGLESEVEITEEDQNIFTQVTNSKI